MSNTILSKVKQNYSNEFDQKILADLMQQGYTGTDLLDKYKSSQEQIKQAIKAMLDNAHATAEGKVESYSMSDVFDED